MVTYLIFLTCSSAMVLKLSILTHKNLNLLKTKFQFDLQVNKKVIKAYIEKIVFKLSYAK